MIQKRGPFIESAGVPGIAESVAVDVQVVAKLVAQRAEKRAEGSYLFADSGPLPNADHQRTGVVVAKKLGGRVFSNAQRPGSEHPYAAFGDAVKTGSGSQKFGAGPLYVSDHAFLHGSLDRCGDEHQPVVRWQGDEGARVAVEKSAQVALARWSIGKHFSLLIVAQLRKSCVDGAIRTLAVYIDMTFLRHVVTLSRNRKFGRYPEARRANHTFGTIRASIALLALLSLLHPSWAFAANPDLETVLTGSRQRIEKLDYRMSGRLTRVEGNGKRTNYKFVAKAHWFPDGLRLLCEISGPGSEKTSLLLHMTVNGHMTIEAVLPGQKTASVLPFERWNDPLVGTDFTYEDMVENQLFWKNQELLPPEKYGARDCFVLKSRSGSQDQTHYDSVTSWIDRGILFPVHAVKTLRGTGQQKDFIYYGLKQASGVWYASQVEAKLQGKPGSSILVIEAGSGKANLGRKDFEIGQFSAQEEKVK